MVVGVLSACPGAPTWFMTGDGAVARFTPSPVLAAPMPRRGGIALVAFALLVPGCLEPIDEAPPEGSSAPDSVRLAQLQALSESRVLVLVTEMGAIRALLYSSYMP